MRGQHDGKLDMVLVFSCFFALNAAMLAILVAATRSQLYREFAGSAVNPILTFCLISALFNIDFIVVWSNPDVSFLETVSSVDSATVLDAYGAYTVIFASTFLGLMTAMWYWGRHIQVPAPRAYTHDPAADLAAQILFFAVLAAFMFVIVRVETSGGVDSEPYTLVGRENPLLPIFGWLTTAAAMLFVAYRRSLSTYAVGALIVCASVLVLSGGARNPVILVCLIAAAAVSMKRRISTAWYLLAVPAMAVFLAISRYVLREDGGKYSTFADFVNAQEGFVNLFIGGEEVSFAKVFVVLYERAPLLPRAPFESLAALLLLPVPRSVFDMKPWGASALFTQYVSPLRWLWTKSEVLITGYGDMYWQFGLLGAFIAMFLLGFGWLWACINVIQSSRERALIWTPALIWSMYLFTRGDLFNVGLLLWPFIFVLIAHKLLRHVFLSNRAVLVDRIGQRSNLS